MPSLLRPQSDDPAEIRQTIAHAFDQIEKAEPWREVAAIGSGGSPIFVNGWANFGAAVASVAFRKNVLGQIELKGDATSPAVAPNGNGTVMFNLPDGYFDKVRAIRLTGQGFSGVGAPLVATIDISILGAVTITLSGVAANAVVTRVSLSGNVYRVVTP